MASSWSHVTVAPSTWPYESLRASHDSHGSTHTGFPDGKEGCELFAVGDEESVAYELREEGKATGEVRVVCNSDTVDVPPDIYAATGYENVGELSWDDKAALGALLACMQLDGGGADDPPPPYPEDEPIYEMGERPEGLAGQVMDELDAEK